MFHQIWSSKERFLWLRKWCKTRLILSLSESVRFSPFLFNKQDTDPILLPNGSTVNCILYADDLVLISCTLFRFCNNWMMYRNIKKTKIIIFQKKRRKSTTLKHQFYISHEKIEITNSNTYLGEKCSTKLVTNGSFKEHKAILKDKDKRSIFATRQHLDFLILVSINISNKLFNSLYPAPSSGVWCVLLCFGASAIDLRAVLSNFPTQSYNSHSTAALVIDLCSFFFSTERSSFIQHTKKQWLTLWFGISGSHL